MKISFFVHDLAANPIVRSEPLIKALQRLGCEVEVLGLLVSGREVFSPYRSLHDYRCVQTDGGIVDVMQKARELARLASGDLIFAGKPLMTSFFPALLASGLGRKRPLFLDIEDDDVWGPYGSDSLSGWIRHYIRGFRSGLSTKYGVALHPFVSRCRCITVSTRALQRRYGGTILRHGPDEGEFDPGRPDLEKARCRRQLGLPDDKWILLFAGTSRFHKGLAMVEKALKERSDCLLLLCGDESQPDFQYLHRCLPGKTILLGAQPNHRMPTVVAAADIVPVLQLESTYTQAQLPAKLVEAMAMGKWIIGTRVGDVPQLLGEDGGEKRGWVIDPQDIEGFAHCLRDLVSTPRQALETISKSARRYFLDHASVDANAKKMAALLRETGCPPPNTDSSPTS